MVLPKIDQMTTLASLSGWSMKNPETPIRWIATTPKIANARNPFRARTRSEPRTGLTPAP